MTITTAEPPAEVSLGGLTHGQRLRLLDTWPVITARYPEDPVMALAAYRGAREYIAANKAPNVGRRADCLVRPHGDPAGAGRRLAQARDQERQAIAVACQVAIMAVADGYTEAHVARELGVDRMTVRKWVGK